MDKDNNVSNNYQVRTDLALEKHQMAIEEKGEDIKGIKIDERKISGINISKISIDSEVGSRDLGKPIGQYLTFEAQNLKQHDIEVQENLQNIFAEEFSKFLDEQNIPKDAEALVIGLGNWNITPDALGPKVVENLLITRHLFELMPDEISGDYRNVSGFAPGVMGITGIETSEVVQGVIEKSKPDFIVVIDALASRSIKRVNTTIQVANTGIQPGSGIGNKRRALDKESLGIPVIAIGVPTVVDAVSITNDTIEFMMNHLQKQVDIRDPFSAKSSKDENPEKFLGLVGSLNENEKRQLIDEVLSPLGYNLMVTPKEVDTFIEEMANIIASGLNMALHNSVDRENTATYTH